MESISYVPVASVLASALLAGTLLAAPASRGSVELDPGARGTRPAPAEADRLVPFHELLEQPVVLDPRLAGRHPRLFFDAAGLERLRARARAHPEAWNAFLAQARSLRLTPPSPPAQERGVHYLVGLALPEPAFAYAITNDPRYLAEARCWIDAVLAYEPWGYEYSKPNQDIPAAHLLYGLAFAYDLLHDALTPAERGRIEVKLVEKSSQLFAAYAPRPGRRYTFSQNHTFINAAALACAAIVLEGAPQAPPAAATSSPDGLPLSQRWLRWARAVFDRTLLTYSKDGYYYEGYHYFEFSVPWIVHYLDAIEFNTGERLYEKTRLDLARLYVAHALLPGGGAFDFGDMGRGAAARLRGAHEILGGHQLLYRVAERLGDPASAAVAEWVSTRLDLPVREPVWRFIWRDPATQASIDSVPLVHHFEDAGVVFARTAWTRDAVAFAFKAGPPEGHAATQLVRRLPEWRQSTGHAHPDAGSFIIVAGGRYLTGDAGYTGVKQTAHHNALLVDGHGQRRDGRHEVFRDVPIERLDDVRITRLSVTGGVVEIDADLAAAYDPALGVESLTRSFRFDGRSEFTVADRARFSQPRSLSILVQSDHAIEPDGDRRYRLAPGTPTLYAVFDPAWPTPVVAPRVVVAQGRPGSVERGEEETRGTTLRVDLPPATIVDTSWSLRLHAADAAPHLSQPGPRTFPVSHGTVLREEQP